MIPTKEIIQRLENLRHTQRTLDEQAMVIRELNRAYRDLEDRISIEGYALRSEVLTDGTERTVIVRLSDPLFVAAISQHSIQFLPVANP